MGMATVYRLLDKLVDEGVIAKYNIDAGTPACFSHLGTHLSQETCYHCKCSVCGKLIHMHCEELPARSIFYSTMVLPLTRCGQFFTACAAIAQGEAMKKRFIIILSALALLLSGCTQPQSDKKLHVVAAIFPEYDWVRQIVGDDDSVELTLLVDDGVDPTASSLRFPTW